MRELELIEAEIERLVEKYGNVPHRYVKRLMKELEG